MTPEDRRKDMLRRVRKAIREYNFTPRELSMPSEADVIMILLSLVEFPYKMPFTKLAIICFTGSRGRVSRGDIVTLLPKDYTTLSHSLSDLKEYGLITESIEYANGKRPERMYTLTEAGAQVFEDFIHFYQQKIIETPDIQANDSQSEPEKKPKVAACALATSLQAELPLLFT